MEYKMIIKEKAVAEVERGTKQEHGCKCTYYETLNVSRLKKIEGDLNSVTNYLISLTNGQDVKMKIVSLKELRPTEVEFTLVLTQKWQPQKEILVICSPQACKELAMRLGL